MSDRINLLVAPPSPLSIDGSVECHQLNPRDRQGPDDFRQWLGWLAGDGAAQKEVESLLQLFDPPLGGL
jgi:hypothetical protein